MVDKANDDQEQEETPDDKPEVKRNPQGRVFHQRGVEVQK